MKFPVHIIILGQEGVGKSALVVRFLTRRFLTEFAETDEIDYERTITLDDRQVSLRITDVSGKSLQTRAASRELLMQADAAVVVYSVTDQSSVTAARHALHCIRKYRPPPLRHRRLQPLPVLLLGNKSDLDHIRTVKRHCEPSDWTSDFTLTAECSARDDADGVRVLFHKLIRKVLQTREAGNKGGRKMSHASLGSPKQLRSTIKRRFSMFSRERISTL
ncbi:ras-related and estrogen-regulated growth inhibitor-like protein [Pomacea canaliculata]|uniref:ras-related and estrogen-regulated growth inhibitor-like protein n=1 Tax=Pomacea canaliculata TaxID=400727 RepID=UPI000D7293FA|nr:ras-related and estrogen-regulated growth inhibitor-like protein [Pomacea canaliculata]